MEPTEAAALLAGAPSPLQPDAALAPCCIQTLPALTTAFASVKPRRAPGIDGEAGDLLKAFPE
eukprot:2023626-Lingulodinium_polyedra.AAC.1